MKMNRRWIFALAGLLLLLTGVSSLSAEDPTAYLRKWDVSLKSGEGALMANLITISGDKIVVKTADADQKTLVLVLDSGFTVMEGKMRKQASDLQRGETVVLVLDVASKSVKSVFKYL